MKLYFCIITDLLPRKDKNKDGETLPLENRRVIAPDAESDMSLMMTVKCLTLSIKSLPLIRVNVYGMLRGVREERDKREDEEERGGTVNIRKGGE